MKERKTGQKANQQKMPQRFGTDIMSINKCRLDVGLAPILIKERKCLKCDRLFMSNGKGNFMCEYCCGYKEDWGFENDL